MRAIRVSEFGGPEVLVPVEIDEPTAAPDQLVIDVHGVGVNFADTHQIEDSYLSPQSLPFIPGSEVVGVTAAGVRVCGFTQNGYAERAVLSPGNYFEVPQEVSDVAALALLVQGLTAWHLVHTCARVAPGDTVVVHAGAGGVGSLAIQLAKDAGATRVIATASSEEKRSLAVDLGADIAIDANAPGLAERLRGANDGERVDVVFEMIGGSVFDASLAALNRFGRLVTYGSASRDAATPVGPSSLMIRSRSVIGFWLLDALAFPDTMIAPVLADLVTRTAAGSLRHLPGATYPLSQARQAHEDLLARRTSGKVVLDPREAR